jgi:hypothetical protein
MSKLSFPVTYVDSEGLPWTAYAHRDIYGVVICDGGTQLFPDSEGVAWLHGHYTREDPEMSALLVTYALEQRDHGEREER